MKKEDAKKKIKFHKKRLSFYKKKLKECKEIDKIVGFNILKCK